jgi:hypothetical protein
VRHTFHRGEKRPGSLGARPMERNDHGRAL